MQISKSTNAQRILGIDYGRAKVGLALGVGSFAEPYKVLRVQNFDDAVKKVLQVLQVEQVDKVVVGVSEGEMAKESAEFAKKLGAETFDETLTSKDAQRLSMEAGVPQKRRHEMEDAYAASLMLQNYLDANFDT